MSDVPDEKTVEQLKPQPLWWYTFTKDKNLYRFHKNKWENITGDNIYKTVINKIDTIKDGNLMFVMADKTSNEWKNISKMTNDEQKEYNLQKEKNNRFYKNTASQLKNKMNAWKKNAHKILPSLQQLAEDAKKAKEANEKKKRELPSTPRQAPPMLSQLYQQQQAAKAKANGLALAAKVNPKANANGLALAAKANAKANPNPNPKANATLATSASAALDAKKGGSRTRRNKKTKTRKQKY
jgi:hypothetical protein